MYPVRIVPRRGVGRRMLTPHLDLSARVLFVDAHFLHNRFHVTHTSLRDTDREAVPVGGKGGGGQIGAAHIRCRCILGGMPVHAHNLSTRTLHTSYDTTTNDDYHHHHHPHPHPQTYDFRQRMRRPTVGGAQWPRALAISASFTMPMATHSPWSIVGIMTASMPWPTVWPKFRIARRPPSLSSSVTTCAWAVGTRGMLRFGFKI